MPALEPLRGLRVVADPAALDAARWHGFGRDRAPLRAGRCLRHRSRPGSTVDDEHAIVEPEVGFAGVWLPVEVVAHHVEWPLPAERPALAQGFVATVPAKVWLPDDGDALLLTAAAYADELAGRLR